MKKTTQKYVFPAVLLAIMFFPCQAQFNCAVRKDVSFGNKVVDMQHRFTDYIHQTNNPFLIEARQLSVDGMRYKDKLENRNAIMCYMKAELLLVKNVKDSELKDLLLADILQNKGRAYHYMVQRENSRDYINRSKNINECLIKSKNIELARFAYFFLATNFDMLEAIIPLFGGSGYPSAFAAVHIKRDILHIRGAEMGRSYWNLAGHFKSRPISNGCGSDSMIICAQLAEKEFQLDKNNDRVYNAEFISTNNAILAERYMDLYHDVDSCKLYTEKAIASLSIDGNYTLPDNLPAFINHEEAMRSSRILSLCIAFIYEKKHDKKYLRVARDLLDTAVATISNHSAETFIQGERNISELNYTNQLLIKALSVGESFPIKGTKCFDFLVELEKAKTYNYQKKLLENQIVHSSQNNGKEIQAIRKLNSQYNQLEKDRLNMNYYDYLDQDLNLLVTIDSLEKSNYKKEILNNIFFSDEKAAINNICSFLKPTTTVLLYYCDDFINLCASVSATGIIIYEIPLPTDFRKDLKTFQILNASQTMIDENWCALSNRVYKGLVRPYITNTNTKELIVISSGILNCIPFESLVTSYKETSTSKKDVHYLMQDMDIRYEYSLKPFYKKHDNKQIANIEKVYAFAPIYQMPSAPSSEAKNFAGTNYMKSNLRSQSFPLKFNVPEAEMVSSSQNGVAFLNNDATENKFREVADSADILHLSMHSYALNDDPMNWGLVFAKNQNAKDSDKANVDVTSWVDDGILHAYEIYQMNLKADMVVLSACETGIGSYGTGEGTRSLGLAFRYAGCNNTVMSLWAVDDEYTGELMKSFYNYLKEGKPKAEALSLAKKDFVKNNSTAGPFFWAGFILYGDNQPVNLKRQSNFFIFSVAGLIAIIIIIFLLMHIIKGKKLITVRFLLS